jgi:Domain of Unknown Function (DUF1206)
LASRTAWRMRGRSARYAGRRAVNSTTVRVLARAGLAARGVLYMIIGWIAVEIAFGHSRQQADQTGALHALAATPVGGVLLWLLAIGFIGMAVWRLSEAGYGAPGANGRKATARVAALGKAVVAGVIAYGAFTFALGAGSHQSSDTESVDVTATLMRHSGGRILVVVIGLAFIAGGLVVAYRAWRKQFLRELALGQMRPGVRRVVQWLGEFGGIARGVVFITVGVFLIDAAADAQPGKAKGLDSSLRALAATPLGPWLLVLVALGLIMFGAFSCCQARWERLLRGCRPGLCSLG